jgi:hypothetical protein
MNDRIMGLIPEPGDIIGCYFPLEEAPENPGNKFRPVLVCAISKEIGQNEIIVGVAYGSAQRTSDQAGSRTLPLGTIEIEAQDSLRETTRFDFNKYIWLPFNKHWFIPASNGKFIIKYSKLTSIQKVQAKSALIQCGVNIFD